MPSTCTIRPKVCNDLSNVKNKKGKGQTRKPKNYPRAVSVCQRVTKKTRNMRAAVGGSLFPFYSSCKSLLYMAYTISSVYTLSCTIFAEAKRKVFLLGRIQSQFTSATTSRHTATWLLWYLCNTNLAMLFPPNICKK